MPASKKDTAVKPSPLAEVAGLKADPTLADTRNLLLAYATDPKSVMCPYKCEKPLTHDECRCKKSKESNPLPICSLVDRRGGADAVAITCPYRFLEGGVVFQKIAQDLLPQPPEGGRVAWIPEVSVPSVGEGPTLGRIDYVGVTFGANDEILGVVSVEFQSVYASGSPAKAFQRVLSAAAAGANAHWEGLGSAYPTTDFLSSWKRIKYQILEKGEGLAQSNVDNVARNIPIRQALVVDSWFYGQVLGKAQGVLHPVESSASDFAIYPCDLKDGEAGKLTLTVGVPLYTLFRHVRDLASRAQAADIPAFLDGIRHASAASAARDVKRRDETANAGEVNQEANRE